MFCPFRTAGGVEIVVQTGSSRFVVNCRLKPEGWVGHSKMRFSPKEPIANGMPNAMLNTEDAVAP